MFKTLTSKMETNSLVNANSRFREILTWTVYPGVMSIGLMIYYGLKSYGINVFLSSYVATIIAGVGLITFFELVLPYRKEWLPSRSDVGTDLLFMILVQVLLPYLLSILVVMHSNGKLVSEDIQPLQTTQ